MSPTEVHNILWSLTLFLGFSILTLGSLWIAANLTDLSERRELLEDAIAEIDIAATTFSFGSNPVSTKTIHRGIATACAPHSPLRSPFSDRPCLAYRIQFGYADEDGLTLLSIFHSHKDHVPFLLDGRTRVALLDQYYRFSAADFVHRREFRHEDFPPAFRERFPYLFMATRRDAFHRRKGRFYEWILPPGSPCEVTGEVVTSPEHYRGTGDLEIKDALIHVGPRDDDAAVLDRLRRDRVTALRKIDAIRSKRRQVIAIGSPSIVCALWVFWALIRDLIATSPY